MPRFVADNQAVSTNCANFFFTPSFLQQLWVYSTDSIIFIRHYNPLITFRFCSSEYGLQPCFARSLTVAPSTSTNLPIWTAPFHGFNHGEVYNLLVYVKIEVSVITSRGKEVKGMPLASPQAYGYPSCMPSYLYKIYLVRCRADGWLPDGSPSRRRSPSLA